VEVRTKAKQNRVIKIDKDHFKIYTSKAPEKGKANKAIVRLLASYLNLPLSKLRIFFGEKSRKKIVEVFI